MAAAPRGVLWLAVAAAAAAAAAVVAVATTPPPPCKTAPPGGGGGGGGLLQDPAGAYAPPVAPVLPMERYPVGVAAGDPPGGGDAGCGPSVNVTALAADRLATIVAYGALKEAPDFATYDGAIRALWDAADPAIRVVVPAAGIYTGMEDVLEYVSLVVGALNGGYAAFSGGDIRDLAATPANASVSFTLGQTVQYYCQRLPNATTAGDCETPPLPALSAHHVSFKPCSALLRQYVVSYDDTATFLAARGATAVTTCARHARWCTGRNAQYGSFGECVAAMDALPAYSCAKAIFQGDSTVCRFKHRYVCLGSRPGGSEGGRGTGKTPPRGRRRPQSSHKDPHPRTPAYRGPPTDSTYPQGAFALATGWSPSSHRAVRPAETPHG